mmetsp:Transcript_78295/g.203493  ORF Transcript_78295/g.203493 Transcript_78295/m.203493 type:complete len:138 (-) Transcript_78295:61-474(-)
MIRAKGDGVWAFRHLTAAVMAQLNIDLWYHFVLQEGTVDAPTNFELYAEVDGPAGRVKVKRGWSMELRSSEYAKQQGYQGSVVWRRIGSDLGDYDLVQVVDGEGNPVQPAFDQWRKDCETDGESPGEIHYFAAGEGC